MALAKVFRARFIQDLRAQDIPLDQQTAKACFNKPWVVYAKVPFMGPKQVIEYLGRYTHKIAISNHRIKRIDADGKVHFYWKNYRKAGKKQVMSLHAVEFLRRFSQHVLPSGFVRIRHYGILSSRNKTNKLNLARKYFGMTQWQKLEVKDWKLVALNRMNFDPDLCPFCKTGRMIAVEILGPLRGPPVYNPIRLSVLPHAN